MAMKITDYRIEASSGVLNVTFDDGLANIAAKLSSTVTESGIAQVCQQAIATDLRGDHFWDGASLNPVPERPSVLHEWDWGSHAWVTNQARAWEAYQQQARLMLDASDITVLRCTEHSVVVPTEWAAFRAALRSILRATTGNASLPLPTQPPYPAGT